MKLFCFSIFILALSQIKAQPASGVIFGVIRTDSSGSPIANATIALGHTSYIAYTDKKGAYRLSHIPPGVYQLRISAPGYRAMLYDNLTVISDLRLDFSIKLKGDEGQPNLVGTIRLRPLPAAPRPKENPMLFYRPDSTVDFKLRIVNPEKPKDSSRARRK
jgi:hypothetical protein